jgi:hypothetical protein
MIQGGTHIAVGTLVDASESDAVTGELGAETLSVVAHVGERRYGFACAPDVGWSRLFAELGKMLDDCEVVP